jgi:hypothetical protein
MLIGVKTMDTLDGPIIVMAMPPNQAKKSAITVWKKMRVKEVKQKSEAGPARKWTDWGLVYFLGIMSIGFIWQNFPLVSHLNCSD